MTALSVAERFGRCEPLVVRLEGGYADNPKDPGGATNMGVTLAALEAHRGHACTWRDVKALSPTEVCAIYGETYWPAVRGDELPAGVDLIVFDAAVNCGRGRAATFLQAALRVTADGQLGPATMAALAAVTDVAGLVERIRLARLTYYRALSTFPTFGRGWLNRLARIALTAAAWAASGPPPTSSGASRPEMP